MSRYRVYIKPLVRDGEYDTDFTEISTDVMTVGDITEDLDSSTYDIGIFKTSGVTLKLRNDHGRFSNETNVGSIFSYKRADAIVKITWDARSFPLKAGFFKSDTSILGGEVDVFEGLLTDISAVASIDEQFINFRILGYESLFNRVNVPYSSVTNGDTLSVLIYTLLNQSFITDHLTVDQANIVTQVNETIDDKTPLENITVREALESKDILFAASSVLYIKDKIIYVQDRTETATNQYTFYGQAAIEGIENIIDIKKYRDGSNKIFNFITWPDTSLKAEDLGSTAKYGVNARSISTDLISDASTTKVQAVLDEVRDEFAYPMREFDLETPLTYDTLNLYLKDKVNIDYPTIHTAADDNGIPRWGQVNWGSFLWPIGQFSLVIDSADRFKIMGRKISPKKDTISFKIREV